MPMPCFISTSSSPAKSASEMNLSSLSTASSLRSPCKSIITLAERAASTFTCAVAGGCTITPPFVSEVSGTRIFMPFASMLASFLLRLSTLALILPYFTLSPIFSTGAGAICGFSMAFASSFALFMLLCFSLVSFRFIAFFASLIA